ncbi:MAG: NRDE family protein [Bacteroidota bacterium]
MCTVTYLPVNKREFILTSNRDEDVLRQTALPVQEYKINKRTVYFPKDQKANGTWIAYDIEGYTLCLLNGAYQPHVPKNNYKKSRGLMLLDFYEYNDPEKFFRTYDFIGIEPFTLIMIYSCSETKKALLHELKWDGGKAELMAHDSSLPQIWSSVTLYSPPIIEERKNWFSSWLEKHSTYTTDDILFFHHFGGVGTTENDLIINRGNKKTVSVCCINKTILHTEIIYEDIVNQKFYKNKVINC